MDRFFLADFEGESSNEFELCAGESHHALHVLRMKLGDELEVFDGKGKLAKAVISKVNRKSIGIRILETLKSEVSPESVSLTLATAVPKGERLRWLIEKTTELGVTRIVPLVTEHSVVEPGRNKIQKLEQTVISACKQSGRLHLLKIEDSMRFTDFIGKSEQTQTVLMAHLMGKNFRELVGELQTQKHITVIIGPEGGFTEEELSLATDHGAELVSLGSNILRIETAAIAFCSRLLLG